MRERVCRRAPTLALLLSCCVSTGVLSAQVQRDQVLRHTATLFGDRSNANFGSSIATGYDLDGGGQNDYLIGAPEDSSTQLSHGLVRAVRGEDQLPLWTLRGAMGDRYGASVAMLGDIDGDKVPDFAIGAWGGEQSAATNQEGYVEFWSTAGGINGYPRALRRVWGGTAGAHLGETMCAVPDIDNDGVMDLLVGANQNGTGPGFALLISGRKQTVLRRLMSPFAVPSNTKDNFGTSVAAGDLTRNGVPELLVGAPGETAMTQLNAGRIYVFDAATGKATRSFDGTAGKRLGFGALHVMPQYLKTGQPAVLAGVPKLGANEGGLEIYDPAAGMVSAMLLGARPGDGLGFSMAAVGDQDADGFEDYLVGTIAWSSTTPGSAAVVSGKTLTFHATLPLFVGDSNFDLFGYAVANAGDLDGDGIDDFAISALLDDDGAPDSGAVRFLTAKAYEVSSDTHVVDVALGGQQVIRIDAGPLHANQFYLVLGSMTGTAGIRVGNLVIPLTADIYTDLTLQNLNSALVFDSFRRLDTFGRRNAIWTAIPPATALRGVMLYHSVVRFDIRGQIEAASRALPLSLR